MKKIVRHRDQIGGLLISALKDVPKEVSKNVRNNLIFAALSAALGIKKKTKMDKDVEDFIRKVQSGEITEEMIVKAFTKDFVKKSTFHVNPGDAQDFKKALQKFQKAKTFAEAKYWLNFPIVEEMERKFNWAKNYRFNDSKGKICFCHGTKIIKKKREEMIKNGARKND